MDVELKRKLPSLAEAAVLSEKDKAFLREVASHVRAVYPGAQLLLYGSRGRGDARVDSDWDILIIADGADDRSLQHAVFDRTFAFGLDPNTWLDLRYSTRERWEEYRSWLEFFRNVLDDAIEI